MCGHDTVVVVGSCYEYRRIHGSGLDVMDRRVCVECLELFGVGVAAAVVGGPVPADREHVIAEHVHHARMLMDRTEKIGPLVCDGSYKQSAVGSSVDAETRCGRILVIYQVLGRG